MKIQLISWCEVNIDKEIERVNSGIYTKGEAEKLIELYERFKRGHFVWCANEMTKWSRTEREYVQENVFDCLHKVAEGECFLNILPDNYIPRPIVMSNNPRLGPVYYGSTLNDCFDFLKTDKDFNDENAYVTYKTS
jgi:hypothetical protein